MQGDKREQRTDTGRNTGPSFGTGGSGIPGVSRQTAPGTDNILGVRVPALRKLAKEIVRGDWEAFLLENDREWYEKDMLQGLVIGCAPMDYEKRLARIREFIPRINNWAVCDVFCSS